jgi:hypothetical protein
MMFAKGQPDSDLAGADGGVLSMYSGTALFDAVAISDTFAYNVRAGRGGDASCAAAPGAGVSGRRS